MIGLWPVTANIVIKSSCYNYCKYCPFIGNILLQKRGQHAGDSWNVFFFLVETYRVTCNMTYIHHISSLLAKIARKFKTSFRSFPKNSKNSKLTFHSFCWPRYDMSEKMIEILPNVAESDRVFFRLFYHSLFTSYIGVILPPPPQGRM